MAILEIGRDRITPVPRTTLAEQGVKERADLQRVLLEGLHLVAPDVMLLTEEFGGWEDSRRRIDILGLDKDANLVVVELKRTEDGGHMELQALRYAAMASVMTFDQAVESHRAFLERRGARYDAQDAILEFLQWDEPNEDAFAQEARIVLVSLEFSKEITTTVLWLNQKGLDIRCVRLTPYKVDEKLLVDVQQIIPLPEAAEFQTRIRQKQQKEDDARQSRDLTRYELTLDGIVHTDLPKRHAIRQLLKFLVGRGVSPESIVQAMGFRQNRTILKVEGCADPAEVREHLAQQYAGGKANHHPRRWFADAADVLEHDGALYVVNNQWGISTERALKSITAAFETHGVAYRPLGADEQTGRHYRRGSS